MIPGTYVVTGAGGFVGRALAFELVASGMKVIGIARGRYPELEAAGISMVRLDLSKADGALETILKDAQGVFHVAAKVDMWGRREDFWAANVAATQRLMAACRATGVQRFVYTSSPSVVADGKDLSGIDESYPYPLTSMAYYPETKAEAERLVRAANQEGVFHTVALRPHLIFGPGDNHFVPTILERAKAGRLPQVGPGQNLTDFTYITDCVRAHVLAMEALDVNPACRGRAYFISQGEPVPMWEWIGEVLRRSGVPPLSRRVPTFAAMTLAQVCEFVAKLLPWTGEPLLTRFLVSQMSTSHYFNIQAAGRDLGFYPRYSMREGMELTFSASTQSYEAVGSHA